MTSAQYLYRRALLRAVTRAKDREQFLLQRGAVGDATRAADVVEGCERALDAFDAAIALGIHGGRDRLARARAITTQRKKP